MPKTWLGTLHNRGILHGGGVIVGTAEGTMGTKTCKNRSCSGNHLGQIHLIGIELEMEETTDRHHPHGGPFPDEAVVQMHEMMDL